MTHKKLDRALGAADSGGLGLGVKKLITNYVALNAARPRSGRFVWDKSDPWRTGCVKKMMHPMRLPISPEARSVKLRVYGHVYYDTITLTGAVSLGQGVSGVESSSVSMATGEGISDWITVDVTEWQARPWGVWPEVQLRLKSNKPASPASSSPTLLGAGLNPVDRGSYINTNSALSGTFDYYDILGVSLFIGGKAVEGFGTDRHWTIRNNVDNAGSGDLFVCYPYTDRWAYAEAVALDRYSRIDIYAIEWVEVIGTPFPGTGRPGGVFPIEDETVTYRSMCPGRQGEGPKLSVLYKAGAHLVSRRTTVHSCRPFVTPNPGSSYGWLDSDKSIHAPASRVNDWDTGNDHWTILGECMIGNEDAFTGDGGISDRTAVDVTAYLYVLHPQSTDPIEATMRLRTEDEGADSVTSEEIAVTLYPVDNRSYTGLTLSLVDYSPSDADRVPELGTGRVAQRSTLQGLWEVQDAGRTGVNEVTLRIKDASGLAGKSLVLEILGPEVVGANNDGELDYWIIVHDLIVVGAEGSVWSEIGT